MKGFKRKKGKKYPEMVDTIHDDFLEDAEKDGEASWGGQQEMSPDSENVWDQDYGDVPEELPETESEDYRPEDSGAKFDAEAPEWGEETEEVPDPEIKEPDAGETGQEPEEEDGEEKAEEEPGAVPRRTAPWKRRTDTEETEPAPLSERDLARQARMRRRKREMRRIHILAAVLILLLVGGIGTLGYWFLGRQSSGTDLTADQGGVSGGSDGSLAVMKDDTDQNAGGSQGEPSGTGQADVTSQTEAAQTEKGTEAPLSAAASDAVSQADLLAAQYDYDKAIELLKSQQDYSTNTSLQQKVTGYEEAKAACVEIAPDTVSHVFVHSLIVDPTRAFDGQDNEQGYNKNMVTLEEFKKIIQSMYDNGYVLVSLHDMGEIDENGRMQRKSIYLPQGKKPVIFSQDDVSYYHSYENDGFPDRLIVDENGDVKNEYTDASGNTTVGDYDMVPVLDTFIKEHPDFSYRGRKGIVVLTGYNGVLGYHTDGDYRDKLALQADQAKWLEEHPEFDFDADVAAATKVADAMKANGWEFASHTWGHISVSDVSLEKLQTDTQKWLDYVSPIVGSTDMIIFAFGSDIGDWTGYSSDNEKFNYLKSVGFDYFCNVDGSSLSWVQFGETYLRTGRMNIDGYRMSANPDVLAPLFDVSQVYDYNNRPQMAEWSQ